MSDVISRVHVSVLISNDDVRLNIFYRMTKPHRSVSQSNTDVSFAIFSFKLACAYTSNSKAECFDKIGNYRARNLVINQQFLSEWLLLSKIIGSLAPLLFWSASMNRHPGPEHDALNTAKRRTELVLPFSTIDKTL
jgi:hypothetical protein